MKVFVEEQKFKRWILLSVMVIPLTAGIIPIILDHKEIPELNSGGFWGILITITAIAFVLFLMLSIKLNTKIDEQGIHYKYFPNHFSEKYISWNDIDKCYLKKHPKFGMSSGYGYRRCFGKKGLIMNLGGKYGIQLELKSGKRMLIGTQKKDEVEKVLSTYNHKLT